MRRSVKSRPPRGIATKAAVLAGILLLMVGTFAVFYFFDLLGPPPGSPGEGNLGRPPDTATPGIVQPPAGQAATVPSTRPPTQGPSSSSYTEDALRTFLQTEPPGDEATVKAGEFSAAGRPDFALLIYRYADRKGDVRATISIARMYDPKTYDAFSSPFPKANAGQAARYYRRAAEAGNAEAQLRLGQLMIESTDSSLGDAEEGVMWVERAAKQKYQPAMEYFSNL